MKTRIMRICAAIMAAVVFAVGLCGSTAYAFDNSVKEGTVAIVFYLKGAQIYYTYDLENFTPGEELGDIEWSGGSGFFVGSSGENPQYIVTNDHVIEDYLEADEGGSYITIYDYAADKNGKVYAVCVGASSCEMRVYYSQDDYDIAYVDCHGEVDKVDLAVLRLRNGTDKRSPLKIMEPSEDMIGDTVYTVGYPGNADNDYSGASKYGIEDASVHKGSIVRFVANTGKGVERISIDATVQHGNSGGPLVTEEGYVIGVNTNVESNSPYDEQLEVDYYAISATELVRFLDKNSIPYETADSAASVPEDQGGEEASMPVDAEIPPADTGKSGGVSPVLIVVGILVLAAVVAAVLVVVKKQGKKPDSNAGKTASAQGVGSAAAPAPQASKTKGPIARSLSPQHNGLSVSVGTTPILVGRDRTKCAIAYADGTAGVSGRHCSIVFDLASQSFVVTDLGSTYGTFLMNGQRLQANVPCRLKVGDSFCVGDKANVIRLELG